MGRRRVTLDDKSNVGLCAPHLHGTPSTLLIRWFQKTLHLWSAHFYVPLNRIDFTIQMFHYLNSNETGDVQFECKIFCLCRLIGRITNKLKSAFYNVNVEWKTRVYGIYDFRLCWLSTQNLQTNALPAVTTCRHVAKMGARVIQTRYYETGFGIPKTCAVVTV